jgi:hypothetical protein
MWCPRIKRASAVAGTVHRVDPLVGLDLIFGGSSSSGRSSIRTALFGCSRWSCRRTRHNGHVLRRPLEHRQIGKGQKTQRLV